MTNTATTTTPTYRWVWFQTTRSGKRIAFGWSNRAHRAFRIGLAEAELLVATEQTEQIAGHPFKAAS